MPIDELRNSLIRHSIFDSVESFDPEYFNKELTTEGLVAGCGSLIDLAESHMGLSCIM
jgi:hypothetical protein